jgi:tRNA threonylcarbamoyladenosine biosynthesis protein TsaE
LKLNTFGNSPHPNPLPKGERTIVFQARDEDETAKLGVALAGVLPPGSVVALNGPLGAGKTRLVQALAEALGVPRSECVSPTFMLINEYRGRLPIYHFDAYRVKDEDEFFELGPDEYFEGAGITLVEWAERVERCLPTERLEIRIEPISPTERRFEFVAMGAKYAEILNRLRLGPATG